MNRSKQFRLTGITMVVFAGWLLAGCSSVATRDIETERAALHSEPVSMNAKDLPEVNIDSSGAVKVGKDNLSLTTEQRVLTREYRAAVIKLVDMTLSDTARITDHAMSRMLFAALIGRADEAGEKIGKQAEALVHSPQFCHLLGDMRQSQDQMVQSVTTLQPYAKITPQTVENCTAGKPYDLSI
jgi:hypothetical protein